MTSFQISLAAIPLFLEVFLVLFFSLLFSVNKKSLTKALYIYKKVQKPSSVERRKLQQCVACYIKPRLP